MMKKTITLLLSIVLLFTLVGSVGAASNDVPMFKVNGKLFVTPKGEPAPYINKDERTMGSLRLIASALGVESKFITWDKATSKATLVRGNNTVSVVVGKKEMTVNGKKVVMDTVAEMKNGRVFIPAKYIAQGLGVQLGFENATKTVLFYTGEVAKHNFEDYGLTPLVELPLVLETSGLELTVHEAFIYPTDAPEAVALNEKYKIRDFEYAHYFLWTKVTLKNNSKKLITNDYRSPMRKVGASNGKGNSLWYANTTLPQYLTMNNTNVLHYWTLEPGESITSYVPFLDEENSNLEFIEIGVQMPTGTSYKTFAEKVN